MDRAALRRDLLAWYDTRRRDLPWRRTGDPYAVWVSEVMLQQTRVETAVPYYEAWMARFPTVEALAAADEEDVLAAWSGLGYYARARSLHRAARQVVAEHGGRVPRSAEALQALPGIGDYTAGALASIAFGEAVPAVDGNAERVVARWCLIDDELTRAPGRRKVREAAADLVDPDRPGDWNQAVMELGATACTPTPRCDACPVQGHCRAYAEDVAADLPRRRGKKPPTTEPVHFALIMGDGRLLLVKRPDDGLLAGTWGLPGGPAGVPLPHLVSEQAALQVQLSDTTASARHVFSHRVWEMEVRMCHVLDVEPREPELAVQWVPLNRLDEVGLSSAMKKAVSAAGLPVV